MAKKKLAGTAAVRVLKAAGVDFIPHTYKYEARGGTAVSSRALGVDEHTVIKTLVMETAAGDPLVVLMHGDAQVSTKSLARHLGVKAVSPCDPHVAQRHSGYTVGGTSPFGLRKEMPVYAQRTIEAMERIFINGGRRGFLVELSPHVLGAVLEVEWVDVATG